MLAIKDKHHRQIAHRDYPGGSFLLVCGLVHGLDGYGNRHVHAHSPLQQRTGHDARHVHGHQYG